MAQPIASSMRKMRMRAAGSSGSCAARTNQVEVVGMAAGGMEAGTGWNETAVQGGEKSAKTPKKTVETRCANGPWKGWV